MNHESLMVNLVSAVYWFDEALQARLKANGYDRIGRTQSMLLANIAAGEHRATRIARNLGISRQAVSQILVELVARGIVTVSKDAGDRRARLVEFHPGATKLRQLASASLADIESLLAERLGVRRLLAMRQALAADWGDPPGIEPIATGAGTPRSYRRSRTQAKDQAAAGSLGAPGIRMR